MSDNDLIRKGDVLALIDEYVGWGDETISRIRDMPAVTQPAPDAAAMTPEAKRAQWELIISHLTSPEGIAALRRFEQTGSVAALADHLMALPEIGGQQ